MVRKCSLVVVCFLFLFSLAFAQEGRSDLAVSAIGVFPKQVNGNGVQQDATNSGGFLISYNYRFRAHQSIEGNYAYTRDTQYYTIVGTTIGPFTAQQTNVHEITAAYVLDGGRERKLDPFLLAGGGALVFDPTTNFTNSTFGSTNQTTGAFLYGFGLNYRLARGFGLHLQYRGLIYKAPDFGISDISTGSWTHAAEPSIGVTFRF